MVSSKACHEALAKLYAQQDKVVGFREQLQQLSRQERLARERLRRAERRLRVLETEYDKAISNYEKRK